MITYYTGQTIKEETVCALGNFDGVHIGHRALINKAVELGREQGRKSLTYVFDRHPNNVISSKTMTAIITPLEEKSARLESMGLDALYVEHFDSDFSQLSPEDFVYDVLCKKLNVKSCVCGFHYHFGFKGQGDTEILKKLCGECGIEVWVIPPVTQKGVVVSSSCIRSLISSGDVAAARELMAGEAFSLTSVVEYGKQLGRTMGFPTINMRFDEQSVIPKYGVYATKVWIDKKQYFGATNVGFRPTVSGESVNAETNIMDYNGDLYGKSVRIEFYKIIRREKKFAGLDELRVQIAADELEIRKSFNEEAVEK